VKEEVKKFEEESEVRRKEVRIEEVKRRKIEESEVRK
jgi:hypothetical protein